MVYMREWRPRAHEKEVVLSAFLPALNHLNCLLPPRSSNTKRTAQSYPENRTLSRVTSGLPDRG
jgi:hypothetical protein